MILKRERERVKGLGENVRPRQANRAAEELRASQGVGGQVSLPQSHGNPRWREQRSKGWCTCHCNSPIHPLFPNFIVNLYSLSFFNFGLVPLILCEFMYVIDVKCSKGWPVLIFRLLVRSRFDYLILEILWQLGFG